MSRWEFMSQLEDLLSDIPPGEREEALQYYNDYFNDAGGASEQEVINALGTPEQVAQIVKEGISGSGDSGEFTENGFSSSAPSGKNGLMKRTSGNSGDGSESSNNSRSGSGSSSGGNRKDNAGGSQGNSSGAGSYSSSYGSTGSGMGGSNTGRQPQGEGYREYAGSGAKAKQKEEMPVWAIVLIVIGCVLFSPAILGILCAAFGIIVGIFATAAALVFGVGVAALVLFLVAVALILGGFSNLWVRPLTGVGLIGGGLICGALGILFLLLAMAIAMAIPGICKGIAHIFRKLFGSKGGAR